ncbi:MAG: ATP-binding cassette domain-containing protein [Spirochaetales bacterium]|nr:ATP-binding cassette domain-containing protein [Spirochaetales bacterium]
MISVTNLEKSFKVQKRENAGLASAFRSVFSREYETVRAVHGLSFSLRQGEIRGLIGPNGAGKSTTIKVLSGILFPSSGEVSVLGMVPWKNRVRLVRQIGVVLGQKSQLIWDLPAIDTFALHKKMYGIPDEVFQRNIGYFSEILHMQDHIKKPVRNLSLGERMKAEFMCALLHEPPLVFLDEPTIGLDVISKDAIRTFIRDVNREKGTTFILTTHDLSDIERICHNVSIINYGTIVFDHPLERLKKYFANKKLIELQFREPVRAQDLSGFKVQESGDLTASIEIDTDAHPLEKAIAEFFQRLPVSDININNISIEEVIKHIYALKE